jgi:hypothetical protein
MLRDGVDEVAVADATGILGVVRAGGVMGRLIDPRG